MYLLGNTKGKLGTAAATLMLILRSVEKTETERLVRKIRLACASPYLGAERRTAWHGEAVAITDHHLSMEALMYAAFCPYFPTHTASFSQRRFAHPYIALDLSGLQSPKHSKHRIFTIASSYKTLDDSCHTEKKYSHRQDFPFLLCQCEEGSNLSTTNNYFSSTAGSEGTAKDLSLARWVKNNSCSETEPPLNINLALVFFF